MWRSPGSTAPGGAKAARRPTAAFGAPQTTLKCARPVETRHSTSRCPWLSPSSRSIAPISPMTTPRSPGASGATLATYPPALIRRAAACAAATATAQEAQHVDLRRRLGEREEGRPEADLRATSEHLAREELERALEIADRDVAIDGQAFDLVEHRRVRDVGVAPVDPARHDEAHGRPLRLHRPDLHGRGVRPQQRVLAQVERVLHVARRIIARDVEIGR